MYLLIFYRPPVQKSLMNRLLILNFTLKIFISLCWYSMNWFTILKPHCLQEVIFKMRRGLVTFTSLIYFSLSCSRISMVIFPAKYQERNFKSNTCNEHTDSTQNSDRSMDVPFQEIIFSEMASLGMALAIVPHLGQVPQCQPAGNQEHPA